MSTREIFLASGRYEFCEVLAWRLKPPAREGDRCCTLAGRMIVQDGKGRIFPCKPMYGTWGEVRGWDRP